MATGRTVGEKHLDLAVLHPARRGRVLTLDARAALAFFDKACLIHNQHGVQIAQMLNHVGAQSIMELVGIPASTAQQVLDAVWR